MRRIILAIVLGTLSLGTFAQEAFYIYRNDGDFNGFFYDEVQEMRYSKLDFDSVEHDNYVMYEVELADTLYRIPLAAIDSIGFQQPEIIINPEVRHMDLLGMTPYVTARDSQTLIFSQELPDSLMPQTGNVLFGMGGLFQEENFGGRVTSVRNDGNSIIVETNKLTKLSDIFVQFITLEEVGFSEDEPTQLCRRMAGMNKIKQWDGSYSLNTLNINANLHIPITYGGAVGSSIDAGVYLKCRMVVIYQIHDDVYFIKCATHDELGLQAGFTIQAEISKHEEKEPLIPKPFATIGFPAYPPFPLFELTPVPQLGYRYGGNFVAKVALPTVAYNVKQTFVFDSELPELINYSFSDNFTLPETEGIFDAMTSSDAEVKLEGYFQIGVKEELSLKTNQVFSSIISASTGVDIWVGPKIDGSLNLDVKSFFTTDDGPYIFRDSHVGMSVISVDMEAYSEIDNLLMDKPIRKTWADGSIDLLDRLDLYAFPKFTEFDAIYNNSLHNVHAAWNAEPRCILWPCQPGIVLYRVENGEANIKFSNYDIKPKFGYTMKENFEVDFNTAGLKQGVYKIAPSLMIKETEFPVRSMAKEIYIPYILEIDKDTVHFNALGSNEQVVNILTNYDSLEFAGTENYVIEPVNQKEGRYQVRFTYRPNCNFFIPFTSSRSGVPFAVIGSTADGSMTESRNIEFTMDDSELTNVYADLWSDFKYMDDGLEHIAIVEYKGAVNATRNGNSIHITGTQGQTSVDITFLHQPYNMNSQDVPIDEQVMVSGTISTPAETINFTGVEGVDATFGGKLSNGMIGTMTATHLSHPMLHDSEYTLLGNIIVLPPGDPSPFEN